MKILVVDDSPINRVSAYETLKGHEVVMVQTIEEALMKLWRGTPSRFSYLFGGKQGQPEFFEAVLLDLMLPADKMMLSPKAIDEFVGREVPAGYMLALRAGMSGMKYVAVASSTNHHAHPAAAWVDHFASQAEYDEQGERSYWPCGTIGAAAFGIYEAPMIQIGEQYGKDWGKVLSWVMKPTAKS